MFVDCRHNVTSKGNSVPQKTTSVHGKKTFSQRGWSLLTQYNSHRKSKQSASVYQNFISHKYEIIF
jgi:hypothetical protein